MPILAAWRKDRHAFDLAILDGEGYMVAMQHHHPHDSCDGKHGHQHDAQELLRAADTACLKRGVRLTTQRRAVLEALAESARPLGAYELIELLRAKTGRSSAPIAIYRALDFLKEQGLIHRLETLNAFIACPHQHRETEPVVFLICETCRSVEEAAGGMLAQAVREVAHQSGFVPQRQVLELGGRCRACAGLAA